MNHHPNRSIIAVQNWYHCVLVVLWKQAICMRSYEVPLTSLTEIDVGLTAVATVDTCICLWRNVELTVSFNGAMPLEPAPVSIDESCTGLERVLAFIEHMSCMRRVAIPVCAKYTISKHWYKCERNKKNIWENDEIWSYSGTFRIRESFADSADVWYRLICAILVHCDPLISPTIRFGRGWPS